MSRIQVDMFEVQLERLALKWNRAAVPFERKRVVSDISTFGIVPSTDSSRGHDALGAVVLLQFVRETGAVSVLADAIDVV